MAEIETELETKIKEDREKKSILHQVTDTKALIEKHYYRIEVIERILASKEMDDAERNRLETELDALKEILQRTESELQNLHNSNRETTKMASLVAFLVFCIYCIYAVFTNDN
eukprot:TRINITY_DN9200_c0_g1_i1.p1 TRINITY_DN9200_c0_g1~~TRINITY_DN9200_c0_g1_i1.p1  ORF type:complete len:113 (+),score=30.97 TRINITY_DN9200_c0_g1_i1:47-385(+)